MNTHQLWLLYCRPGFEKDCAEEALRQARLQRPIIVDEQVPVVPDSGYVLLKLNESHQLDYGQLIFTRQLIRVITTQNLPERDRISPIIGALQQQDTIFGTLWLEVADTNEGKTVSSFTRRFQPLIEPGLIELGKLENNPQLPRLHLFFPNKQQVIIGCSDIYNSNAWLMGIHRQAMPSDAPSRSTLKLAEAFETFFSKSEQGRVLRAGMTAVDLGAAPGGWTYQLVKRSIKVAAIDNGPMKGSMAKHPLVQHLKQDGFKFTPRKTVDWLVCDMVEKPLKVAELIASWFVKGYTKQAIFNLKLPMKQRVVEVEKAFNLIKAQLEQEGISYKLKAKQLYHDREEITVYLARSKH